MNSNSTEGETLTASTEATPSPADSGGGKKDETRQPKAGAKRGGTVGWVVAGGLGVLLVGAAAGAWYFYDQGQRQAEALTTVLEDISGRARELADASADAPPELEFLRSLGDKTLAAAPPTNEIRKNQARLLFAYASAYEAGGDSESAAEAASAGADIYASLGAPDAGTAAAQWTAWAESRKAGEALLKEKKQAEALAQFEASAKAAESLVAIDEGNLDFQLALSESSLAAGDVLRAAGDPAAAKLRYQAALKATDAFAAANPGNVGAQSAMAAMRIKLGDLARRDAGPEAAEHYAAALKYVEEAATKEPENIRAQRNLWSLLTKLGDQADDAKDDAQAKAHYDRALAVATAVANNPAGARYKRDLFTSYTKLGDLARGDDTSAQAAYDSALKVAEELAAGAPNNSRAQHDVVLTLYKIGDQANRQRDTVAAQSRYAAGVARATAAVAADPQNVSLQQDIATGLAKQGDVAKASKDMATAKKNYQAAAEIYAALVAADPTSVQFRRELASHYDNLGTATGDTSWWQKAVAAIEPLAAGGAPNNRDIALLEKMRAKASGRSARP